MGKLSFFVGAGLGYVLGARAGRQQFEKIKSASQQVWDNPRVQSSVNKVEEKVSEVAKEKASAVTDKVTDTVKSRMGGSSGSSDSSGSSGSSNGDASQTGVGGSMRPTPPQPEL
ncbi:YtxH domain-containing protein [Georgenia satyanarayanai]|uniref:YtxH domain-containing protein n=1 Tax=Georgenia satyanarayanai TaxID=860221 RepID=UPI00203F390A|nr:YtxH domain-containing protein [Georgenia satyanarayanai]MCM3661237.1 YtxH domain-containing protein [Georgenia satyanarayanai]